MPIPRSIRRPLASVARSRLGVRAFNTVYATQFGPARRVPGVEQFGYWLATQQPLTPEQRTRSVVAAEQLFFDLVERIRPALLIEAGAKDGGTAARVKSMLPDVRSVAFEANPYTFRRFRRLHGGGKSGVEYLHLALSDQPGEVSFCVRVRHDGRPSADGQGSLLPRVAHIGYGHVEVSVQATTLDEFFADDQRAPCAMWMDVEGASMQVLAGAAEVLQRTAVLIVEADEQAIWDGGALRRDLVQMLREQGFEVVARDFQSRYQMNLVFVRRDLIGAIRPVLTAHRRRARPLTRPGPR